MCKSVWNSLSDHAYYGDETFAGDSVSLGLGRRLDFIFKKGNLGAIWGQNRPWRQKYSLHHKNVLLLQASLLLILFMNGN